LKISEILAKENERNRLQKEEALRNFEYETEKVRPKIRKKF